MSAESPGEAAGRRVQSTAGDWLSSPYELGPVHPNTQPYATFETKPRAWLPNQERWDSGGGYERWRSYEYRPHTLGGRKEDVYAPHHRLLAVVACYPLEMPLSEILDDLHGKDVHHTMGVEWLNFGESPNFDEPGLEVIDHGRHSEITQQQRLTWAKDKKDRVEAVESEPLGGRRECVGCGIGDDEAGMARVEGVEGVRCLSCAREVGGDGRSIEVL